MTHPALTTGQAPARPGFIARADSGRLQSAISRLNTSFRSDQCLAKLAAFRFDIG
jgi:hypothetical protein